MSEAERDTAERLVRWGDLNDRRLGLFEQQATQLELLELASAYLKLLEPREGA